MQRAARVLQKVKLPAARLAPEELGEAVWPAVAGKRLASRTGPVRMYGRKMVVEVEDDVWKRQLSAMAGQLLIRLQQVAGPSLVDSLEFRVGLPKRRPPAMSLAITAAGDPADGITDPIFRHLYLASREESLRTAERKKRISA
jgi:predicted nucleic acid-binding Zn ribbon protein